MLSFVHASQLLDVPSGNIRWLGNRKGKASESRERMIWLVAADLWAKAAGNLAARCT